MPNAQRGGSGNAKNRHNLPPRCRQTRYNTYHRVKKGAIIAVLLVAFAYVALLVLDAMYPPNLARYHDSSTIVGDRNGRWLRVYLSSDDKRRIHTPHVDLPDDYLRLLINYEDRDFYRHNGIDVSAIIRAIGQNIAARKTVSGASTLTMQTAKLLNPKPRTLGNKIIETFRAWQLERRLSKAHILDIYATLAPAGGNREGLSAAAYYYLNKPVDKLSLGESAWLVALPQSPARLSNDTTAAIRARNKVLKRALDNAVIDKKRYQQAIAEPLAISQYPFPLLAPHISNQAKWQHEKRQSKKLPATTTVDTKNHHSILLTSIDKPLQRGVEQTLAQQLRTQHKNANLAAAIIDNHSGQWLAYAGTAAFFDKQRQGQVDMLSAVRSPGSALKPFISLFAFDWLNYHPQTTIDDTPIQAAYQPNNYDGRYHGRITLSQALSRSRNVPAVRLLQRIKPDYFAQALIQRGVTLSFPHGAQPNLSLALGGVGIRGRALAQLYRQLANCSYTNAKDSPPLNTPKTALAEQRHCQQVSHILRDSQDGQGRVFFGREPVAFKTGTAYGWRDRWVFAYTTDYTIVLWNGRADGQFAEKRASAEALIPVLRDIIALLPNSPQRNTTPTLNDQGIANQHLPPRLRHVGASARSNMQVDNAQTSVSPNAFSITAPLPNSVIDYRPNMRLSFHIQGGQPPYIYLLNDDIFAQSPATSQAYPNPVAGHYHLIVIDANGNSTESRFRLQAPAQPNTNKRATLIQTP